tara:strand:- start:5481 stop:7244 length:1764 start_codon:yes stop_codon:yes gene_type:complete
MSRASDPRTRFRVSQSNIPVATSALSDRYFSKEDRAKSYTRLLTAEQYHEKLDWKAKGVDPITLNKPAKVFPYGGGLAPVRSLTKQELVARYLGSRAIANVCLQYKHERGTTTEASKEDIRQIRRELIEGYYSETFKDTVPIIPYPVFKDEGPNVGTVEESIMSNRVWWNKNVFSPSNMVNEKQDQLSEAQVKEAWDRISPELYARVGTPVLEQDLGRERPVPSTKGYPAKIKNIHGEWETAHHGFDYTGTVNSARNQELLIKLTKDLEEADRKGETSKAELLEKSIQNVKRERALQPRWAQMASSEVDPSNPNSEKQSFAAVIAEPDIVGHNLEFWGGGLEQARDADPIEKQDAIVNWNNNEQSRALHAGSWETNYINPEFEPGMFSHPNNIEYRTVGVTAKYNRAAARKLDVTPGEVERKYIFGQLNPRDFYPNDPKERERFDRDVADASLNTQSSTAVQNALKKWVKEQQGKNFNYEGHTKTSALLYLTPNETQKINEEEFAGNPDSMANWNTTRHEFAENIAPQNEDAAYEMKTYVKPLRQELIDSPKAESIETGLMEESNVWAEYARVRGDERSKSGYTLSK